jgi:hypothetical protein
MGSMECNMQFGYQLSIVLGPRKHGKTSLCWPVAGPSRCKLASSQQSGIKYGSPNISPYLYCCLFFLFAPPPPKLFCTNILCVYNLDKHQTVYNTCGGNEYIHEQYAYKYIYICICDSLIIVTLGSLL